MSAMMKLLALTLAMGRASAGLSDCPDAITVLRDVATGWPDDCRGLQKVDGTNTSAACKDACYKDMNCSVWQLTGGACWTGLPKMACRARTDFKADAGQRIQRGEVTKTKAALGVEVMGLLPFKMATGNESVDEVRCKEHCYSDVNCGVWQYTEGGCWVENVPDNKAGEISEGTQFAKDVKFGEFVERACPVPEEPFPWIPVIIGAILALIGCAILGYMLTKKPKVKKTRAVKIEPKKEIAPVTYFIPQPTVLIQQPVQYTQVAMAAPVAAPVTTYSAPVTAPVTTYSAPLQSQPLLSTSSVVYR